MSVRAKGPWTRKALEKFLKEKFFEMADLYFD